MAAMEESVEVIVLSSDMNFDAALRALADLGKNVQLETSDHQVVSIDNIECNNDAAPFVSWWRSSPSSAVIIQ